MKKRLIALMIASTITATVLTGCGEGKTDEEINNENEIREMLEYDANINISKNRIKDCGFQIDYEINNEKFYITFSTKATGVYGLQFGRDIIKYEVDKDTYYDFKNNYNSHETQNEVERVKNLTEKYDPVEIIDSRY
ncbi:MAG: hypothetical protein IJ415_04330 [Clostridia bacterium]|nr:hypothetical protein [Clostridia bacterium]